MEWVINYMLIGLAFALIVEWLNHNLIREIDYDYRPMNNFDRLLLCVIWPVGILLAIKSLIDHLLKRK